MQRRRPRPVAETGRSCWGSGLQDASAVQGTKQTQGAATRRLPRLESSGDLAVLNTQHLLRKPVCALKAPPGLSCPTGTAVLSGTLLCVQKSTYSAVMPFAKAIESAPRDYALHRKHFPHTKGCCTKWRSSPCFCNDKTENQKSELTLRPHPRHPLRHHRPLSAYRRCRSGRC